MSGELLPCPFCGGTDIGLADNTGPKICSAPYAYAWCKNRDCFASGNESDTVAQAIAAWNQRTRPDELIEAARAIIAMVGDKDIRVYATDPQMRNLRAALAKWGER